MLNADKDDRYGGSKEAADKVYEGCESLTPEDVTEVIVFAVGRRENVVIADTLLYPNHQVRVFRLREVVRILKVSRPVLPFFIGELEGLKCTNAVLHIEACDTVFLLMYLANLLTRFLSRALSMLLCAAYYESWIMTYHFLKS